MAVILSTAYAGAVKATAIQSFVASRAGARLDSNLAKGGGSDDTEILQSILDRARNGASVLLVLDGPALVTGLTVYGNTQITCTDGAGFYLKDESDRSVIRNAHRSRGSIVDQHIYISGCFVNGNRFHQLHMAPSNAQRKSLQGRSRTQNQTDDGTYLSGLELLGVTHLTLKDLTVYNARSFGIWIANASSVKLSNIHIDDGSPRTFISKRAQQDAVLDGTYAQTDGIHMNGPVADVRIDGLYVHSGGDDALALNANDGSSTHIEKTDEFGPYVGEGPITNVTARNIVLDEQAYGIRLLSADQPISGITIEDVSGTVVNRAAIMSHWIIRGVGKIKDVLFRNWDVSPVGTSFKKRFQMYLATHPSLPEDPGAQDMIDADNALLSVDDSVENIRMQRIVTKTLDNRPLVRVGKSGYIRNVDVDLFVNDASYQTHPLEIVPGAHVRRLSFDVNFIGSHCQRRMIATNLNAISSRFKCVHRVGFDPSAAHRRPYIHGGKLLAGRRRRI